MACRAVLFFSFLFTGDELLASALREEVGSPHLSHILKNYQLSAGPGGRAGKSWTPQRVPPSRPEPNATVHSCLCTQALCTRALCARGTQNPVSFGYRVLVFARLWLWLMACRAVLFFSFLFTGDELLASALREEVGSPHLSPSTPEPASRPHKVKARPINLHHSTALNVWTEPPRLCLMFLQHSLSLLQNSCTSAL